MSDDLETAKTALAKLHQDMEAINRLAKPSYLKVTEQMERTMEPIRRQQLEISRTLEMSGAYVNKIMLSEEGYERAKNEGLYIKNNIGWYVLTQKGMDIVGVPVKGGNWLSDRIRNKGITLKEPIRGVVDEITGIKGSENIKLVEYTIKPIYPKSMSNIQDFMTSSKAKMKFEKFDDGWRKK